MANKKKFFKYSELISLPTSKATFEVDLIEKEMSNIHFFPNQRSLQIFKVDNGKSHPEVHVNTFLYQEKVETTVVLPGDTLGINMETMECWVLPNWKRIAKKQPLRAARIRWRLKEDSIVFVPKDFRLPIYCSRVEQENGTFRFNGEMPGPHTDTIQCVDRYFVKNKEQKFAPGKFFVLEGTPEKEVAEFIHQCFENPDLILENEEKAPFKITEKITAIPFWK
jgi:hypothetical protein